MVEVEGFSEKIGVGDFSFFQDVLFLGGKYIFLATCIHRFLFLFFRDIGGEAPIFIGVARVPLLALWDPGGVSVGVTVFWKLVVQW